jgi:hypothetical protein
MPNSRWPKDFESQDVPGTMVSGLLALGRLAGKRAVMKSRIVITRLPGAENPRDE